MGQRVSQPEGDELCYDSIEMTQVAAFVPTLFVGECCGGCSGFALSADGGVRVPSRVPCKPNGELGAVRDIEEFAVWRVELDVEEFEYLFSELFDIANRICVKLVPGRDTDLFHELREPCPFDHIGRRGPGKRLVLKGVRILHKRSLANSRAVLKLCYHDRFYERTACRYRAAAKAI